MKKSLVSLFALLFLAAFAFAQSVPQGIKFQAVARNLKGEIMPNRVVSLQTSLVSDNTKIVHYTETHHVKTNSLGLFDIAVGGGKVASGEFSQVPWAEGDIWLQLSLDIDGSGHFDVVSNSRLLTVPYAFHAATAGEVTGASNEPTPESCGAGSATGTLWSTKSNCATAAGSKLGTADLKPLVVVTNNIERFRITPDGKVIVQEDMSLGKDFNVEDQATMGRVTIKGNNSGGSDDYASYPLQMEGSNQGIAIKMNGSVGSDNTYVAFMDSDESQRGSIVGQTAADLYSDPFFIIENAVYAIELVYVALDITGLTAELATVEAQVLTALEGIGIGVQLAAIGTKLVQLTAEYTAWLTEKNLAIGIEYGSGSADYAEWLEKENPALDFKPGQIVGIKGGKISLETTAADHVMVVSTAPIVIGNQPEKSRESDFEKIAFMGQVPVAVVGGARQGDFILASGNDDGYAVAVSPANMKTENFDRIVGVAWENSKTTLVSHVNTAIGINTNDLADRVAAMQKELKAVRSEIDQIKAFLKGETKTIDAPVALETQAAPVASAKAAPAEPFKSHYLSDDILEQNRARIEEAMTFVKAEMVKSGFDFSLMPTEAKALLDHPIQTVKDVQSGKHGATVRDQILRARAEKAASGK